MVALVGKSIDALMEGRKVGKYLVTGVFVGAIYLIVDAISMFILGFMNLAAFTIWIIIGLALSLLAIIARKWTKKGSKARVQPTPEAQ